MASHWVPPYFGSWDDLVKYVVNSALHPKVPRPNWVDLEALPPDSVPAGPVPDPWKAVTATLVSAVTAKQLALSMKGSAGAQMEKSASAAIEQVLDDYCGTPPRKIPWPYPGPPPWSYGIASELMAIANASQVAGLREDLTKVAGQVVQRGFGD
jgi:hypothetical protein